MEVMCVKPFPDLKGGEDVSFPKVGDKDIVITAEESKGFTWYELERFGPEIVYRADHFATLPNEDSELIEEGVYEAIVPNPEPKVVHNSALHPIFQNIFNSFIKH